MLRLSELKLPLNHSEAELEAAVLKRLRLRPGQLRHIRLVKRSIDARKQSAVALVYCLDLDLDPDAERHLLVRAQGDPQLRPTPDEGYRFVVEPGRRPVSVGRPVVVGAGPCGYFAALVLAQMGFRPLLLERGQPVKQRSIDTFGFWKGRLPFNPESNAQFGEGGAGTFSDGKLYSQVSEPRSYVRKVLEELTAAGAHPEILTLHRPHIGTFKLATVVRGLRARVQALGGEVRFGCRVEALALEPDTRRLSGVVLEGGEVIGAAHVVLAIGHSARDTFAQLQRQGVAMQPKPFAVGLRIEHPQPLIDRARHGAASGHPRLGPAEYKLVHHCREPGLKGRDVYSFCMCPGGLVVGAASEPGGVVTNGMSQHSRNERNANSALVVNVNLSDLETFARVPGDPLAGVAFQRHWERLAYECGGGGFRAPVQSAADFLAGRVSEISDTPSSVLPSYQPGVRSGNLLDCLPAFASGAIREALPVFAERIQGFLSGGAMLTGVETRTSSPVRVARDSKNLQSTNTPGLYPGGEGGGYAGGILSAAIDGIKLAEAVALSICS
ncbi:MAG: FAD-dependent oxidoreductase [Cyanobacteriota bacterium]|nr:FAD-dependent oxidoreductase [Cyanobacteriota bacterium]